MALLVLVLPGLQGRAHAEPVPSQDEARIAVRMAQAWTGVAMALAALPEESDVVTPVAWERLRAGLDRMAERIRGHELYALEVRLQMTAASMDVAALEGQGGHSHDTPDDEAETATGVRLVRRGAAGGAAVAVLTVPDDQVQLRRTVMVIAPEQPTLPTRRVVVARPQQQPQPQPQQTASTASGEVWRYPIANPRVTSPFGPRTHPVTGQRGRMHRGVDFGAPTGTPIIAPASGRVVAAGWCDRATGNCIVIDHENGWRSQYFHLSRVQVRAGQTVRQGDRLGSVGSTGRSTGPHLHFQVGRDGQAVDPMPLIGQALSAR